ncbi:sulfotransferase family protein [Streptomyces sp. NBC_00239]|uniref:sulfotransferase family protein n=1 Tax=Streptomyces sp. NBC_00239 TaxID=2903640 RepID=UPI002E2B12BA|nr:sulfotransferase [Streptomyces sp. NBC_00239]
MRSLTFIVGTGRSGSTALSRIVNMHPDVLSLNELLASVGPGGLPDGVLSGAEFWRLLADPNPVFETMIRSGLPLPEFLYTRRPGRCATGTTGIPALLLMVLPHLSDDPDALLDALAPQIADRPVRPAADHYRALFGTLCERFGRTAVIERSGYSGEWVPRLHAAFPEARFVHLFRNGPDCALSMSRHPGYRTIVLLREILERTGVARPADLTPAHVRTLPPDLSPLLGERFDPALVRDRAMPVGRFGELWSHLVIEAVTHLERVPGSRRATLSYEDLLDDPETELARLAEFAGVEPLPRWLDAGRAFLDAGRRGAAQRLPATARTELAERCAPGTRALGGPLR